MSDTTPYQVSEKAGDAIIVVRGTTADEFTENLLAFLDDSGLANYQANPTLLNAIDEFSSAVKSIAPVQVVKTAIPGSSRTQPASGGGAFSCDHGTRNERSGTKKDGTKWSAYFCPDRKCKPLNPDGTEWK